MFSSFAPSSFINFGFGRGSKTGTPITLPPVEVHDVETAVDKRGRRLKHLLKLNHHNFAILFHHLQFHNHTPHHLGSAYLLNCDADHLTKIYEDAVEKEEHEPWEDSPSEIAHHDWRDFLGKKEYQRAFVDFFEDQLVQRGYDWKNVVNEFLLEGKQPLINCVVSGLGHPLIHLGYAYELDSREVAMEALGLVATCYNHLHKYSDDESYSKRPTEYTTSDPFEVLARINMEKHFDSLFNRIGGDNMNRLFGQHEAALLSHWNAWKFNDPIKQFEQSQKLAVALLISTASSVGGHGYDFFLVHLLTTSHAVRILLPNIPSKFHIPLVRQWFLIVCAIYIAQLRPTVTLKYVEDYDLAGRDWSWAEKQALDGKHALDAHYVKAVRAAREAARVWGDEDKFYLKAATKFAEEFTRWGGFEENDEAAQELTGSQREKR